MDAFEAAKLNEDKESVVAVKQRDADAKALVAAIDEVGTLPADSPYAEMDEGLVMELCKREGMSGCAAWTSEQRRIALEVIRRKRLAAEEPAPAPAVDPVTLRMPGAVPLPSPNVDPPRAVARAKGLASLPPSANGCYVVSKGGRAFFGGGGHELRAGKVISRSYRPADIEAMLACGIELEPQEPIIPPPPLYRYVGDQANGTETVVIAIAVPAGLDAELIADRAASGLAQLVEHSLSEWSLSGGKGGPRSAAAQVVAPPAEDLIEEEAPAEEAGDEATRTRTGADTDPQTPRGRRRKV